MKHIEKELVSEETIEQGLNVTLHANTLKKDGSLNICYARIHPCIVAAVFL